MTRAIELARFGDPSPNPHVGCVVVQGDTVVGEGFHESAGFEHAEIVALQGAGERARVPRSTLRSSLATTLARPRLAWMPSSTPGSSMSSFWLPRSKSQCSWRGHRAAPRRRRRSCLEFPRRKPRPHSTLVEIRIDRAFVSLFETRSITRWPNRDSDRRIEVDHVPRVESRVQELRVSHDAVMVGINTVSSDDPRLTVRDVPGRDPIRVVVDSKLRMPMSSQLVTSARESQPASSRP